MTIAPGPNGDVQAAKTGPKIVIIGGGSAFVPGVFRGLLQRAGDLGDSEVILYDEAAEHDYVPVSARRLAINLRLGQRMVAAAGVRIGVRTEADLRTAMTGADFIFTTFRPGGYAARHLDEAIPLRHGIVGQETAGPGGFFMACRSVPVLLRLAELRDQVAPLAWIVNYTNPTSIVTAAVERFGSGRIVGMCDQSNVDDARWTRLLRLSQGALEVDWMGLNHATWAQRVRLDGVDISALVADRLLEVVPEREEDEVIRQTAWLGRAFGLLVNSYLHYYFFHDEVMASLRARSTTRAEDLMARLPALYENYAAEAEREIPDPSTERGGRGQHGQMAVDVICALSRDERRRVIANAVNRGAISDLPDDAIVEVPCLVGARGATPLAMGALPLATSGITAGIESYERLAAEAAATGDRRVARQALLVHPFVRSAPAAEAILEEGLTAHRDLLPQFYPKR
ncbi:MAG: glycoside hydrolase family 4 [Candidatus Dormiibacterota bacterium]